MGARRGLLLACCIGLLVGGSLMRIPTVRQGLLGDERLWLDRGQDVLTQLPGVDPVTGYEPGNDLTRRPYLRYEVRPGPATIPAHHPGALTTLVTAFAMRALLPEHPGIGSLVRLRAVFSGLLVLSGTACFLLLVRLSQAGVGSALLFAAFLLTEPMLLGESRIIRQDALLVSLLTPGAILFGGFLDSGRKRLLVLAGALFGLACATKLVAFAYVLLGIVFLAAADRARWGLDLLRFVAGFYVAFLVANPTIWGHPLTGFFDLSRIALESSQAQGSELGLLSNLRHCARTLTHLSPLFLVLLALALVHLAHSPQRDRRSLYLAANGLAAFGVLFASSIKEARYLLPAVPFAALLALRTLDSLAAPRRKLAIGLGLLVTLVLHGASLVSHFPYHSVYTWEVLGTRIEFPHERLTRTILLPEVGAYLDQHRIGEVDVQTGHQNLAYYYSGVAQPLRDWDREWILVSEKYFHQIPPGFDPPVKTFWFREHEVFRLYHQPVAHP
jgi:hypothetical protein